MADKIGSGRGTQRRNQTMARTTSPTGPVSARSRGASTPTGEIHSESALGDVARHQARWSIYQVNLPGAAGHRLVLAPNLARAVAIGIGSSDELGPGQPLFVWNVTAGFLQASPTTAGHTWSLLKERREGVLDYVLEEGWIRLDPPAEWEHVA